LAQATAVTRRFGSFTAVREVSVRVGPGEIVGLLGANGAGKTTLIRMLLGLIGPSSGEITLFGEAPSRSTRSRLGYVPQGLGLYDDLTPAENMAFSAAAFGTPRDREVPWGLADQLRPYESSPVGSLPLGVQRRVAFAQALEHRPELLVLDEPTSGVDPLGRARLWETIGEAAAAGAGVLVTTHYMEEAGECDRLVIMADGSVVAEGTAQEIVGSRRAVVVESAAWAEAFAALEGAGLGVALAGRGLRVPGADPAAVRLVLGQAGLSATVRETPASLEERFFELVSQEAAAEANARAMG
jgi:ABC-2 type transport system ATP-binding protein/ribosome-dependent ATPase